MTLDQMILFEQGSLGKMDPLQAGVFSQHAWEQFSYSEEAQVTGLEAKLWEDQLSKIASGTT